MKRRVKQYARLLGSVFVMATSLLASCTGVHTSRPPGLAVPSTTPAPRAATPELNPVDTISTVQYGIASWYGEAFQGRPTASGETYEMFNLTAAHREVAFGTQAVVTNLDNGKTVRVRINDRGPFKYPRILDLSYGAARLLDMVRAGSARVKIVFLTPGAPAPLPLPRVYTVQAGAYRDFDNATRVQQILAIIHPTVAVTALEDRTQVWYRVRLGQFTDRDEAQRIARQIQEQGYVASVVALSH